MANSSCLEQVLDIVVNQSSWICVSGAAALGAACQTVAQIARCAVLRHVRTTILPVLQKFQRNLEHATPGALSRKCLSMLFVVPKTGERPIVARSVVWQKGWKLQLVLNSSFSAESLLEELQQHHSSAQQHRISISAAPVCGGFIHCQFLLILESLFSATANAPTKSARILYLLSLREWCTSEVALKLSAWFRARINPYNPFQDSFSFLSKYLTHDRLQSCSSPEQVARWLKVLKDARYFPKQAKLVWRQSLKREMRWSGLM